MKSKQLKSILSKTSVNSNALIVEQHKTLAAQLPTTYAVVILTFIVFVLSYYGSAPNWITLYVPIPFILVSAARMKYWLGLASTIDDIPIEKRRADISSVIAFAPTLSFLFSVLAVAIAQYGGVHNRIEAIFLIWIVAFVTAFSISCLPKASITTLIVSSVPLVGLLLSSGEGVLQLFAVTFLLLSALVIRMLITNYHSFYTLIQSRIVVDEKHREAELARAEITQIAFNDELTGIVNRNGFYRILNQKIADAGQGNTGFAVGILGLDGFKTINDLYGYEGGDTVLQQTAFRLERAMNGKGNVARLGADEFAILIDDTNDVSAVEHLGDELRELIRSPFWLSHNSAMLTCSLGFSIFSNGGETAHKLLENAEQALFLSKSSGRSTTSVYDQALAESVFRRSRIEQELRLAIRDDQVDMYFQPIVDMNTGALVSFEALARWTHEELGFVTPDVFIDIAEQSGLIGDLTNNLLRKAAITAKLWPAHIKLSFNLSAQQVTQPNAGLELVSILGDVGLNPNRVEMEITETAIMGDIDKALLTLDNLKSAGISIVLDDFGTGHSSLSQIRDLPLDKVKIDKCFIDHICTDRKVNRIIRSVLSLCSDLGLACVSEGIETVEQYEALLECKGVLGQGYLFSRPVTPEKSLEMATIDQRAMLPEALSHSA